MPENHTERVFQFSPALRAELVSALNDFIPRSCADSDSRLHALACAICTEVFAMQLTPERLVRAIKAVFEGLDADGAAHDLWPRSSSGPMVTRSVPVYFGSRAWRHCHRLG
mgnify:CR=1 FL=1